MRVGAIAATAGIAKRARREQPAAVEPERVRHISFSRGFDLSGLFEDGKGGSVLPEQPPHPTAAQFVSAAPVEQILATLARGGRVGGRHGGAREG